MMLVTSLVLAPAEETINKLSGILGIADPTLAGSTLMQSQNHEPGTVGKTYVCNWSLAPSSLWSGDARQ